MEGLSSAEDRLTISDVSGSWGASVKIRGGCRILRNFFTRETDCSQLN
jgi:hypothetical protein